MRGVALVSTFVLLAVAASACGGGTVTGEECRTPEDCPAGFICRGAACVAVDGDMPDGDTDGTEQPDGDTDPEGAAGPRIEASPSLSFGAVQLGGEAVRTLSVANAGDSVLKLTMLGLEAGTTTEFSLLDPLTAVTDVEPGGVREFRVRYAPRDPGSDTGNLEILSNDLARPKVLAALLSEYKGTAHIDLPAPALDFGQVEAGGEATLELTVACRGVPDDANRVLTVSGVEVVTGAGSYRVETPLLPLVIPPDQAERLPVVFAPTGPGAEAGALVIRSDDPDTPEAQVALNGSGVAAVLAVSPPLVDFGSAKLGREHSLPVTLTNAGGLDLSIGEIRLGPETTGQFRLDAGDAPGSSLPPGGQATVTIFYTPDDLLWDYGTLVIASGSFRQPLTAVPLQGTGIHSNLVVQPGSIPFGLVETGTTGHQPLTLLNNGAVDVTVAGVVLDDPAGPFALHQDDAARLPLTVAGGGRDEFRIAFSPAGEREYAGGLTVVSDDSRAPAQRVSLTGIGAAAHARLELVETGAFDGVIDFGDVRLGDGTSRLLRVWNDGRLTLLLGPPELDPGAGAEFSLYPPDRLEVDPGGSIMMTIAYRPEGPGTDTGGLTFATSDRTLPVVAADLTGRGTDPAIVIEPARCDFAPVLPRDRGVSPPFAVSNAGTVGDLTVTEFSVTGADSGHFGVQETSRPLPAHLPPGEQITFTLSYTPAGVVGTPHAAVLKLRSNDYLRPEIELPLSGIGMACPDGWHDYDDNPTDCEYPCTPEGAEECDGRDNNCDGSIDEQPDRLCPDQDHARHTCEGADGCIFERCIDGWLDLDGNGACEYFCIPEGSGDEPDDDFNDSDCDGIDGEQAAAVFVDAGAAGGDGSRQRPFGTLAAGVSALLGDPARRYVLAAAGTYPETLTLRDRTRIHGGYNREAGWRRTGGATIVFGAQTGLTGVDLAGPVLIDHLTIRTGNANAPGQSVAAVYLARTRGVTFRNCQFQPGNGGPGAPGIAGANGSGSQTDPAFNGGTATDGQKNGCNAANGRGGIGGDGCGDNDGGTGGNGGCGGNDGTAGNGGGGQAAGRGGAGGAGESTTLPFCIGSCDSADRGGDGSSGGAGQIGSFGTGGDGFGLVTGGLWQGNPGGTGSTGGPGSGGGGGGGGGGGECDCHDDDLGGGGGGGGGGGCGGTGGGGGGAGGGSFGLFAIDSIPVIERCLIGSGSGGAGGAGGQGGEGGAGGAAGAGGTGKDTSGGGGHGATGGAGGRGGAGGGGGGGVSFGLFFEGGSMAGVALADCIFEHGPGGPGGSGGGPGGDGSAGSARDIRSPDGRMFDID